MEVDRISHPHLSVCQRCELRPSRRPRILASFSCGNWVVRSGAILTVGSGGAAMHRG